ncbi:MAG TPA: NAD(P)H-dependent oxidoreductase [Gemmatimonadales bacterium]|nr:NAD(P)H-dependent oxidoreductase [Gemmatimonadales bacterium]
MNDKCAVKVLVFSASLRGNSLDGDVEREGPMPEGAVRLRDRLLGTDGFILVAPEYNASMPGILKNVIDWTSRFKPQPFSRRYGMLMSASPSMTGGNRGLWALRVPLEHLGARVYPDMFSLAQAHQAFDAEGGIADSRLQKRLDETIACWLQSVEAATHYPMMKTKWVEFLGERPDEATDRVEETDVRAA